MNIFSPEIMPEFSGKNNYLHVLKNIDRTGKFNMISKGPTKISDKLAQLFKNEFRMYDILIVGGGIRSKAALDSAFEAGADLVVVGTAFEENDDFFDELKTGR